jgi:hypothetical protein
MVTMKAHRHSQNGTGSGAESEEEYILQRLASKRSVSRSPQSKGKGRSVSYTTTTTTTTKSFDVGNTLGIYEDSDCLLANPTQMWDDLAREQEGSNLNRSPSQRPKTPAGMKSGSGSGNGMSVSKTRSVVESPRRSGGEEKMKVRKTSGRVGSASYGPVGLKR